MLDKADFTHRAMALQGAMYRVACGMLHCDADRQDAMQQALQKAWEKRGGLRTPAFFDSWLIRILINECKAIYRRQARAVPVQSLPEEAISPPDLSVHDAVERLPENQRICVMLHYLEGLPTQDIARLLRIPPSTVRSRLARGRDTLRLELSQEEHDETC